MPTSKVTEIGHNWPDIFITGQFPPMQATTCLAHILFLRGATRTPEHRSRRLNVSGTPQSFLDWSERRKEEEK